MAHVIIFEHPGLIENGYTPVIHCHTARIACRFDKIRAKIDKQTSAVIEVLPANIRKGDAALVEIRPIKPMCVEVFKDNPGLGRFAIRDSNYTVGVGVVKEVTPKFQSLEDQHKQK